MFCDGCFCCYEVKMCPLVFMVRRAEYNLAKFLDNLIKSHLPDTYLLKSASQFVDHVRRFKLNKNQILVLMQCRFLSMLHYPKQLK